MLSVKLVTTFLLLSVGAIVLKKPTVLAFGYIRNRYAARKTGLPYVSVPYLEFNIICGIIARTPIFALLIDHILPRFLTGWAKYLRPDWRFIHKYKVHRELGDLFQVVTPELVILNIADADVIRDVLARRSDFLKVQRTLRMFLLPTHILACTDFLSACQTVWRERARGMFCLPIS